MEGKRFIFYFINSLLIFLATYIVSYYLYQFAIALMANSYNIHPIINFRELQFGISNSSELWRPINQVVPMVTFSGPILSLILGLFTLIYLRIKRAKFKPVTLLVFLWLAYHLLTRFFAGFISACIELDEVWLGYTYLELSHVFYYIFWAMSLIILSLTGFIFFDIFLLSSGSSTIKNNSGGFYLSIAGLLVWLSGSVIIYAFHLPYVNAYEIWILLFMGLIPISQNLGRWLFRKKGENLKLHRGNDSIEWVWGIVCIIIIAIYRFDFISKITL